MSSPVIFAYALNGPDAGKPLKGDAIREALAGPELTWVHLDALDESAPDWLRQKLPSLDSHAIEALFAEETRPRATEIGDGLLVFLRGVNLNEGAEPEDMISVRLWADPTRVISVRRRKSRAVLDLEQQVSSGQGPIDAGSFLAALVERLTRRMEPVLQDLDEATDDLEESVVADPDPDLRSKINAVRRRSIALRRYIAPQRDAVAAIRNSSHVWIAEMHDRRLTEAQDQLTRFVENLDLLRERMQLVKDELASVLADRLNRNTYILSVIAAVFLPLSFLTGLLGINVGGIPGANVSTAFWIFTALLLVIVVLQIWLFRKLKWF